MKASSLAREGETNRPSKALNRRSFDEILLKILRKFSEIMIVEDHTTRS